MRKLIPAFALFFLFTLSIVAQESIDLGESVTFTLNGETPTVFTYAAQAGDVITITVHSLHELAEDEIEAVRDTVVYVTAPSGKRIAYNDNHHTERDDLLETDSVIEKLLLPVSGSYEIHVNTYGGIFVSEVELTVEAADLFEAEIDEENDQIRIEAVLPSVWAYSYTFDAQADETIRITARDLSHTLDPLVRVLDPDGELLTINDDHNSRDLTLDVLDSRLDFTAPTDGEYTVQVIDFLGREGRFELILQFDP